MLCSLREIIEKISVRFPTQVVGMVDQPIRMISRFQLDSTADSKPNTLYIGTPADLDAMPVSQNLTAYPMLCVVDPHAQNNRRGFSMKTVVFVYHEKLDDVYLALAEVMYELGADSAPIPQIYRELLSCRTAQDMLHTASDAMKQPLFLMDNQYRIFATAKTFPTNMLCDKLQSFCECYPNIESILHSQVEAPAAPMLHSEMEVACFLVKDMYFYLFPVENEHGRFLGWLVLSCHSKELTTQMIDNCIVLVRFLAMELQHQEQLSAAFDETGMEKFLQSILNAELPVRSEYEYLLAKLNWQPKKNLYAFSFSNGGQINEVAFNAALQRYFSLLPQTKGVIFHGQVVLVHETDQPLESEEGREALTSLIVDLEQHNLHCGISHAFHSVFDLRKYYQQATTAMELGMLVEPETHLHWYDRCAIYQLFEQVSRQIELNEYLADGLRRLIQYDQENSTELVKTLEIYLQCRGNTAQCAKQAFLHVSTVKYRVGKIESILGYSLTDGESFFQLYLSLKILQYQKMSIQPPAL